jgi:3-deoxy-D-manno-octulosonate 8-phosphate phosphatase KdsC-like HAD superfamily phosphatase
MTDAKKPIAEKWSDMEESQLRSLIGTMRVEEIGAQIGRTAKAVLKKISRLGLQNRKEGKDEKWSDALLEKLTTLGPTMTARRFMTENGTTKYSTYYHAKKFHIKFVPDLLWTEEDVEVIKRTKNATEAANILGRKRETVVRKAKKLGIELVPSKAPEKKKKEVPTAINKPVQKKVVYTGSVEFCKSCGAPVSDWIGHTARMGCRRIA